jgi:hypothetical protein
MLQAGHTHGTMLPEGVDFYTLLPILGKCL